MPIELIPFDLEWSRSFERARSELIAHLPPDALRKIEHVGSTAVPGLAAKPVVDMICGVDDLSAADPLELPLGALGYVPWHGGEGRRSFERRDPSGRPTHHLHIVSYEGPIWFDQIAFRDWLTANGSDREEYARVKQELANQYDDTRDYSEAKSSFIQQILARSRAAAGPS